MLIVTGICVALLCYFLLLFKNDAGEDRRTNQKFWSRNGNNLDLPVLELYVNCKSEQDKYLRNTRHPPGCILPYWYRQYPTLFATCDSSSKCCSIDQTALTLKAVLFAIFAGCAFQFLANNRVRR